MHLLVRGDRMRASGAMQTRVLDHPNVTVHLNTEVRRRAALGQDPGKDPGKEGKSFV